MEFERIQPKWKVRKAGIEAEFEKNPKLLEARLIEELKSSDLEIAANAAESMGWLRLDFAISDLVSLLSHEDEWLRDRASFALGRMPRSAGPYLAEHAPSLQGSAYEHAVKAFVRMKLAAVPILMKMFTSNNSQAIALAHKALCQIKFPLEELSHALSHSDTKIRVFAIDILGKSRDEKAVSFLAELDCSFSGGKQKQAVAMARLARHCPDKLIELAGQPMSFLYLQALSKAGQDAAWQALGLQLEVEPDQAKPHLIRLLRNFPEKPMLDLLKTLSQANDTNVLKALLDVLAHNRRAAFLPILKALKAKHQANSVIEIVEKVCLAFEKDGIENA